MANQVIDPDYFLLRQEILPSGNQLLFSYDEVGHLISIEMKNTAGDKVFSWIHFFYYFDQAACQIKMETSDARELIYDFVLIKGRYHLSKVSGSHAMPISYEYDEVLVKKILPEGRFIEVEYGNDKVKLLKGPHPQTGESEIVYSFSYGKNYTDVFNALGVKTRYLFDKHLRLKSIKRFDEHNGLYRIEKIFLSNSGLLLGKTIGDWNGQIHSYRSFHYDKSGNVIEERLYGNLTGKQEVSLQISREGKLLNSDEVECHIKTFEYSSDGLNLLTKMGDSKGNQTLYLYQPGTNLLIKKFIFDKGNIKKRTFQFYNDDGVCVKIIEDDGSQQEESDLTDCTEKHITHIKPKETVPGVGLPEIIEEKALDFKKQQEILIKKWINTYDCQSNRLSCSTYDANGQYVFTERKTYHALGLISSETDASGRETYYTYDGTGNQISISISQEKKLTTIHYDFHNNPIQITEQKAETQFTLSHQFDILGRKINSTDRFGNLTHYEYDCFGRLTKVIYPEVFDENHQIIRPFFSYTYDIFGHAITIEDPKQNVITKSYNLRGDPTKINYPDGSFELFKYDPEGSLHRSLTHDQIVTVYEYDFLGRSIYEESFAASETGTSIFLNSRSKRYNGFRCTYEREGNHVKCYEFDPAGRLTSFIEKGTGKKGADSRLTEIIYDPLGRLHQKKVWFDYGTQDFARECFAYDQYGNVNEKWIEDAQGIILLKRSFTYNGQGQYTEEYNIENGIKTDFVKTIYNSEGEPICITDGCQNETKVIIYDAYQNDIGQTVLKKILINPIGVQTEIEFDALCRVYAISKKDSAGLLLSSQKILYDSLGNKACEIHDQIVDGKILSTQKTRWRYGPMGRLEEEIEAADSPLEHRTQYHYNSLGQMISKTIPGTESTLTYSYNKAGRLYKIEAQKNKKELRISNRYSYDRKGNVISARSVYGKSVHRTYNAFDQVTEETINDGEGTYTLKYTYDRKGRLKEIVLPDESKIKYAYDALFGRSVTRISSQGEIFYTHSYDTYDCQGKLLKETYIGCAGSQNYTYDLNGQKIASQNDFFNEQCTRDSLSRLIQIKGEHNNEYSYNALSQLTSEKKLTYAYDSLDNRIKLNDQELLNNALNQLTIHSKAIFSYDPQGNLLRKVLEGEETRFENNLLSQLISIEKSDQTSLSFSYDPFGRLLVEKQLEGKKQKTLSTTRYFYIGHQEIGSLTKNGTIVTLKIPGLQGDELSKSIAFEINGKAYVPLHDLLGNVIRLIEPHTCQCIESYQYTSFGVESIYNPQGGLEKFSIVGNPWRFAEKRFDPHSGYILFGLRFYDLATGRWISKDPEGLVDGPNLYAYLHNNPLNYLDRFGLATEAKSKNKFDEYFYGEVEKHCYCEKHRTCKRGGDIGKTNSPRILRIRYCEYFEQMYPKYERSKLFDLSMEGFPDLPENLGIGFINGICNDEQEARASALYISRLSGGYNIHALYNATHGTFNDLRECCKGLQYIATDPVHQLHNMWNSFFEKSSANSIFLMICRSQGAIHVRNALLDYPIELQKRILVVAIAPAAYIYQETCFRVFYYRAMPWRDFIPRIDRIGAKRAKNTIIDLNSLPNTKLFDREFESPTYQKNLRNQIINYFLTGEYKK